MATTRRIGLVSGDVMMEAVELDYSGLSIREVAKRFNIANETLGRYVRKQRGAATAVRMEPNYCHKAVFDTDQEKMLVNYLIECAKCFMVLQSLIF